MTFFSNVYARGTFPSEIFSKKLWCNSFFSISNQILRICNFWLEFLFFAKGNNNVKKSHLFSNIYVTQREVTHISI